MSRIMFCNDCFLRLGELATGSKVKPGTTHLCIDCETNRQTLKNNPLVQMLNVIQKMGR